VSLDLRPEAQYETTRGEVLEIPGRLCRLHGGAGESDGDGGAQLYLMRLVRCYGQG
jgi:hypothetical protein